MAVSNRGRECKGRRFPAPNLWKRHYSQTPARADDHRRTVIPFVLRAGRQRARFRVGSGNLATAEPSARRGARSSRGEPLRLARRSAIGRRAAQAPVEDAPRTRGDDREGETRNPAEAGRGPQHRASTTRRNRDSGRGGSVGRNRRRLPIDEASRRRRHGRGVARGAHGWLAPASGRPQTSSRSLLSPRAPRPYRAREGHPRLAESPPHRQAVRCGPHRQGTTVSRSRARRGESARRICANERARPRRPSSPLPAIRGGRRLRAFEARGTPGHQALQHSGHRRRERPPARLRDRETPRGRPRDGNRDDACPGAP